MRPEEIEKESFKIIAHEAGNHGFNREEWKVVRRVIHTSADFEYLKSIRLHKDAISLGVSAILAGKSIVTDTELKACVRPFRGLGETSQLRLR